MSKDFELEYKEATTIRIDFTDGSHISLVDEDAKWFYRICVKWNRAVLKMLRTSTGKYITDNINIPIALLDSEGE